MSALAALIASLENGDAPAHRRSRDDECRLRTAGVKTECKPPMHLDSSMAFLRFAPSPAVSSLFFAVIPRPVKISMCSTCSALAACLSASCSMTDGWQENDDPAQKICGMLKRCFRPCLSKRDNCSSSWLHYTPPRAEVPVCPSTPWPWNGLRCAVSTQRH